MRFKYLTVKNGAMTATAGTVSCLGADRVNFQVFLDTNSGYEVAVKPVTTALGTASKNNCAAVLANNDVYVAVRPADTGQWWIARRTYNNATGAAAGSAFDRYAAELWG